MKNKKRTTFFGYEHKEVIERIIGRRLSFDYENFMVLSGATFAFISLKGKYEKITPAIAEKGFSYALYGIKTFCVNGWWFDHSSLDKMENARSMVETAVKNKSVKFITNYDWHISTFIVGELLTDIPKIIAQKEMLLKKYPPLPLSKPQLSPTSP